MAQEGTVGTIYFNNEINKVEGLFVSAREINRINPDVIVNQVTDSTDISENDSERECNLIEEAIKSHWVARPEDSTIT